MKRVDSLCLCTNTIETCVVETKLHGTTVFVIGVYRLHTDTVENFSIALGSLLNSPILRNKTILLAGDLNINLLNTDSQPTENFINMMYSMHFLPFITKPTRIEQRNHSSSATVLDQIWLNSYTPFLSGVILHDIADHYPVFFLTSTYLFIRLPISRPKSSIK